MAVDEARRRRSYERLAEAIGRDEAVTIFELLPPPDVDLATRADVHALDERLGAMGGRFDVLVGRFDGLERRSDEQFAALEGRFDGLEGRSDERFAALEGRFDGSERRSDERFAATGASLREVREDLRELREDLRALRSDVTIAIAGQTRALVLGVLTATVSIGGLSTLLAQLL